MTVLPNSFQTSNIYIDRAMSLLTDPEFRILMFTVRHIMGWQDKINDRRGCISLTMYENGFVTQEGKHFCGCGLKRAAIIKGVQGLVDFGFIARIGKPTEKGQEYQLNENIDWIKLETRKTDKQTLDHKRTTKATTIRTASTSDEPVTSDVTMQGNVGRTMQGNVGRTQSNSSSNPPQTQDKNTTAPEGAGNTPTPEVKIKPGKYTPDENKAINVLLKSWQDTSQNIQPFAYQNKTFRAQAYELYKLNISPELIEIYINNLRLDRFWRDKGISWNKVCSEIIPFLKSRHRMPDIVAKPSQEIVDDGPTQPVANPVLFGGQHEPAA